MEILTRSRATMTRNGPMGMDFFFIAMVALFGSRAWCRSLASTTHAFLSCYSFSLCRSKAGSPVRGEPVRPANFRFDLYPILKEANQSSWLGREHRDHGRIHHGK